MAWHTALKVNELFDGKGTSVVLPGRRKPIAIFRFNGEFFAVSDECTHANAPLSDAEVRDYVITCRHHGAQFNIRTGAGVGPLAYADLRTFPVRVVGEDVQVET